MNTHSAGEALNMLLAVGVADDMVIATEGDTVDEGDDTKRDTADKGVDVLAVVDVDNDGGELEDAVADQIGEVTHRLWG